MADLHEEISKATQHTFPMREGDWPTLIPGQTAMSHTARCLKCGAMITVPLAHEVVARHFMVAAGWRWNAEGMAHCPTCAEKHMPGINAEVWE